MSTDGTGRSVTVGGGPAAPPPATRFPPLRTPSAAGVIAAVAVPVVLAILLADWPALPVFIIGLLLGFVLGLVLMLFEGRVLVPRIEGGAFSIHPALVLFLLVAGVALMETLAAILAPPVTAAAWRPT